MCGQRPAMLFPRCSWPLSRATGLLTRNWSGELSRPGRLDSRRVLPVGVRAPAVPRLATWKWSESNGLRQRLRSAPATLAVTPMSWDGNCCSGPAAFHFSADR